MSFTCDLDLDFVCSRSYSILCLPLFTYVCSFPIMLPLCNPVIPPLAVSCFVVVIHVLTTWDDNKTKIMFSNNQLYIDGISISPYSCHWWMVDGWIFNVPTLSLMKLRSVLLYKNLLVMYFQRLTQTHIIFAKYSIDTMHAVVDIWLPVAVAARVYHDWLNQIRL